MSSESANNYPTICTDGEVQKLWDSVNNPSERPERQKLVRRVIERLRAAEAFVNLAADYSETVHPLVADAFRNWRKAAGKTELS